MAVNSEKAGSCVCFNLRKATRSLTSFYDEKLREHGITTPQFTILVLLEKVDQSKITPLSKRLVMDRTTLTRNLGRLEDQDLVQSERGEEDRRTKLVSLTTEGRRKLEEAFPEWERAQNHITNELGNDKFRQLLEILDRLSSIGK